MSAPNEIQITSHGWRHRWLGTPAYLGTQLIAWVALVATASVWTFTLEPDQHAAELVHIALFAGWGLVMTHLARVIILGQGLLQRPWPQALRRIAPWLLVLTTVQTLLVTAANLELPDRADTARAVFNLDHTLALFAHIWGGSLAVIAAWVLAFFALHYERAVQQARLSRAQLDAAAHEAELRALKAQLNPHFLFNCLNTLRFLIPREEAKPRAAIDLLATLLRASLQPGHRDAIPLRDELQTVEAYLALEQLRFESRLTVRQTVAPACLDVRVPPFLLQTLVENAIKHGIGRLEAGGTVTIDARLEPEALCLAVTNPGTLESPARAGGCGLGNARSRLQLLFGPAARLELAAHDGPVVVATARVPLRPLPAPVAASLAP
jgi:hypothetical protein